MNEGDGEIATSGQKLRRMTGAQTRAVTGKGDVAHVVEPIFNAPMSTTQVQQPLRCVWPRRQDADDIDHLDGRFSFARPCARQLGDMGDPRPLRLKIGTHFLTDFDTPVLNAPTVPIHGGSLLELSVRIGKGGRHIGLKGGLVAFDHKERIGVMQAKQVPQLTMGMQSIKGADAPRDGKGGKQFAGFGNLIGFFAHRHAGPRPLGVFRVKQDSRGGASPSGVRAPRTVTAIDSERIGGRGRAGGSDPGREHLLDRFDTDLRQQPAVEGPDFG